MRKVLVSMLIFAAFHAWAKNRKDIPPAPLPTIVISAQKVFLTNGGGSDLAYDAFYAAIKNWGKYQIVGSPENAGKCGDGKCGDRRKMRGQTGRSLKNAGTDEKCGDRRDVH